MKKLRMILSFFIIPFLMIVFLTACDNSSQTPGGNNNNPTPTPTPSIETVETNDILSYAGKIIRGGFGSVTIDESKSEDVYYGSQSVYIYNSSMILDKLKTLTSLRNAECISGRTLIEGINDGEVNKIKKFIISRKDVDNDITIEIKTLCGLQGYETDYDYDMFFCNITFNSKTKNITVETCFDYSRKTIGTVNESNGTIKYYYIAGNIDNYNTFGELKIFSMKKLKNIYLISDINTIDNNYVSEFEGYINKENTVTYYDISNGTVSIANPNSEQRGYVREVAKTLYKKYAELDLTSPARVLKNLSDIFAEAINSTSKIS